MSPVHGMNIASFISFMAASAGILIAGAVVLIHEFPKWLARPVKPKRASLRQELAEASWQWWIFAGTIVTAIVAVVLFEAWYEYSVRRDITSLEIEFTGTPMWRCGYAGRLYGARIIYRNRNTDTADGAIACYHSDQGKWVLHGIY